MQDLVREALKNLLGASRARPVTARDQLSRLEAMLHAYRGQYWQEMKVLLTALQTGMVDELLSTPLEQTDQQALERLAQRMFQATGISHALSLWAVTSWAEAMGRYLPPEAVVSLPRPNLRPHPRPAAAPPPQPEPPTPAQDELRLVVTPAVQLDLVRVPQGGFLMGSSDDEPVSFSSEQPQHQVLLPEYRIGKYPVTVAQFLQFVRAAGYAFEGELDNLRKPRHPVTGVNWFDAQAFCEWASRQSSRTVRLPSEAEWEKAARGTHGQIYPWGNAPPNQLLCNFDSKLNRTSMVGQYSPAGDSPYGCADMAGNVWEWTNSRCQPYPYRADDGREDRQVEDDRVMRGGSYNYDDKLTRSAVRVGCSPHLRSVYFGFRIVVNE